MQHEQNLAALGIPPEAAKIAAGYVNGLQRENEVSQLLRKHGAKNEKAVAALLPEEVVTGEDTAELEQAIVALKADPATAFLFETKILDLKGVMPAGAGTEEPDKNSLSYAQLSKFYR